MAFIAPGHHRPIIFERREGSVGGSKVADIHQLLLLKGAELCTCETCRAERTDQRRR